MYPHLRRYLTLLCVLMAVSLAVFTSDRQSAYGQATGILPSVVGTSPARGEELSTVGNVAFSFNVPMNRESVQGAFTVSPAAPGSFAWQDDSNFTYNFDNLLERETAYIFTIDSRALSTEGVPLRDTFTLKLTTTGYLAVTQFLPTDDGTPSSLKPTITIVFNRPVVPLGTAQQMQDYPPPFTTEPSMTGKGEWLTTTIYTFKPTEELAGGTEYKLTIPTTLTDVSGTTLKEAYTSTLRTRETKLVVPESFGIRQVTPNDKSRGIFRSPLIRIKFDSPPDVATVEAAFTLTAPDGRVIPGTFEYKEKQYEVQFRPSELLDYSTTYQTKIVADGIRSEAGLPLPLGVTQTFTTIDLPRLTTSSPADGSLVDPSTPLWIYFSAPMKLDDLADRITISPRTPFLFGEGDIGPDSMSARIQFVMQPSTTYTLTIDTKGMVDIWNTPILIPAQRTVYKVLDGDKILLRFVTSALNKGISLETGGQPMGLYNAYHLTRVFVTHRNIDTVGLQLYRVSLTGFLNTSSGAAQEASDQESLIRRWVVPVYNPANIMRYDLLAVTNDGTSIGQENNIVCIEAAPSSVVVGEVVRVVRRQVPTDDNATPNSAAIVNIRNEPGLQNSAIVGEAPIDAQFTITDGPVCADRFVWWKAQSVDGSAKDGWIAEGDLKQPYIAAIRSTPDPVSTSTPESQPGTLSGTDGKPGQLAPGIYRLQMEAPDIPDQSRSISHLMLIASDNITLKVARHGAMAWVTDLKSGKPTANVAVQFYRLMQLVDQQKVLPYGRPVTTDANGLALLDTTSDLRPDGEAIYAVVAEQGRFGIASSIWTQGIDAADFQQPTMFNTQDIALYLYTDRRLYRPGEPVYFRGTLRQRDDATYRMTDKKAVWVEVFDPQGKSIFNKKLPLSAFGSFSDLLTIDNSSPLGEYRIVARPNKPETTPAPVETSIVSPPKPAIPVVQAQIDAQPNDPMFETYITVGNYTPPEFRVNVTAERPHVTVGDTIRVEVDSSYYFGGPVSNGVIQYEVRIDPYYAAYFGGGAYSFEDYDQDWIGQDYEDDRPQITASGSGRTNEEGKFTIEIPAALGKSKRSLVYTIEAVVFDESNQMVAERTQVVVNRGEFIVGVGVTNYVGQSGEPQGLQLIAVDNYGDRKPIPGALIDVRIVQRVWASVQTVEPGTGRTIWQNDIIEKEVLIGQAVTGADGLADYTFTPSEGGAYKVYATARDSRNNLIKASTFLWISGPGFVSWRAPNSNRIELQADKMDYNVGETASILIPTPYQGVSTALITVERGGILKTEVLTLTDNSTIYELLITPDMAPNAFVSVTVIKGEDENNFTASFRTGLIQLNVNAEQLQLNVQVTSSRSKAGPREDVTYNIKVTDHQGKPVQAEVGLALVDEAVLALLPDNLPSLMAYFYSRQGLGVRTANALIYNVDQTTQEIINVQKGGGKGGGDYFGIFTIRKNFITTPLWRPFITTDTNGEATVTVTLPDQLTTWVLDARAYSLPVTEAETTLVGQTSHSLISTRPLLVRPEVPRFYVVGDSSIVSAIVNNNANETLDVATTLEITGATIVADLTQYATIPANGRYKFDWPMTVEDTEGIDMVFKVVSRDGRFTDAAKPVTPVATNGLIPVLRYETPDTVSTSGVIGNEGGVRTEGVVLPKFLTDRLTVNSKDRLDIRVDRSLASSATAALQALKIEPHFCIEQTVSRFLPDAVLYRTQKQLGLDDEKLKAELTIILELALQRLYNDQRSGGGWGWFINDRSDQLISAYAVLGLAEASAAGWQIDPGVFSRAIEGLKRGLKDVNDETPAWDLNRQAFILYVLARATTAQLAQIDPNLPPPPTYYDVSRTVSLFSQRDRMNLDARAFLAMTFKIIEPDSGYHTRPLLESITKYAQISTSGLYWRESYYDTWNWTTDTRTTAIILKALIEVDPGNAQIPDVVRWLMTNRELDRWETTQETTWSVMALTAFMQATGDLNPDYTFDIAVNENTASGEQKATVDNVGEAYDLRIAVGDLLADQVNRVAIQRSLGAGSLYYSARLTTYLPVENVKALSRGITVERVYSLENDKEHRPITSAQVGEVIRVTLDIIVPETIHYAAVEDPIPAGAQAIDTKLATTPKLDFEQPLRYGWRYWAFSHIEYRDDRTVLYAPYLPAGTYQFIYQIRAGVPGTYKLMPTHGYAFYQPEIFGRTDGGLFSIVPMEESILVRGEDGKS